VAPGLSFTLGVKKPIIQHNGSQSELSIEEHRNISDVAGQVHGSGEQILAFKPLVLAMSSDVDVHQLEIKREAFFQDTRHLEVDVKVNNKLMKLSFTPEQAFNITSFLFDEVMGFELLSHLNLLIEDSTNHHPGYVGESPAARVEKLLLAEEQSHNVEVPGTLRKFLHTLSLTASIEKRTRSSVSRVNQTAWSLDFLACYEELREMAETHHPDRLVLLAFLKDHKYETQRGVDLRSLTLRYLEDRFGFSENDLQNLCQGARGIAEFVKHFGPGIIAILPPNAGSRQVNFIIYLRRRALTVTDRKSREISE
jgi:hypothetical protein